MIELLKTRLDGALGSLIWWLATMPQQVVGARMILKVPSSLTHSVIYDFGDSFGLAFKIFYKIILI